MTDGVPACHAHAYAVPFDLDLRQPCLIQQLGELVDQLAVDLGFLRGLLLCHRHARAASAQRLAFLAMPANASIASA